MPFTIEYFAVDETLSAPGFEAAAQGIYSIPTLIVERDGQEVGRFIEKSEAGASQDLLALLQGSKRGVLTTNAKARAAHNLP